MSLTIRDRRPLRRPTVRRWLAISFFAAAALTVGMLATRLNYFAAVAAGARPHFPDVGLIAAQPPAVQIHLLAALGAVGLGFALMLSRKGRRFHRIAGWTWASMMGIAALSSLFINGLDGGKWSYLHIFAGWWLVFLPLGVFAARRHKVRVHKTIMMVLFYGSLLIAGALTFLPGRLMWTVFFG
jgi:uncharacterized membrane protein